MRRNGETSVADFVGHWTVNEKKETAFVEGILPQAVLEGYILPLRSVGPPVADEKVMPVPSPASCRRGRQHHNGLC